MAKRGTVLGPFNLLIQLNTPYQLSTTFQDHALLWGQCFSRWEWVLSKHIDPYAHPGAIA